MALAAMVLLSASSAWSDDWTDIRYYAAGKDIPRVAEMLDRGVDVNIRNEEGWTPLMIAAEAGDVAMVKFLLSRGADPSLANTRGRTAFDVTLSSEIKVLVRPDWKPGGDKPVKTTTQPPKNPAAAAPGPTAPTASAARKTYCQQQYRAAVAAFCSDDTCKMRENRKWAQCLKTGTYF